jgi:hypothetical protein
MSTASIEKKKVEGSMAVTRSPTCTSIYFDKMTRVSINASVSKIVFATEDIFSNNLTEEFILTLPTPILLEFKRILDEAFSDQGLLDELNSKIQEFQDKLK